MAQADGRVVIDTKLDNSGMIAGEKEVEESLRRMADSIKGITEEQELALQKQIDSFAKLNTQYAQQEQKVKALQDQLKEYAETQIPTDEYKDLEAQIEAAYEELDKLVAKQNEYKSLGVTEDMMPDSFIQELDQAGMKVGELEEKLVEMQETGSGFTLGIDTDKFAQMNDALNVEEQKLAEMNNRLSTSYESVTLKMQSYANTSRSTAQVVGELAKNSVISGVNKLGSSLKTVASRLAQIAGKSILNGIKKLTSSIKGAGNSASKAGVSFKKLLGYGLGFRSLYSVFSKLKSYISEGLDSLSEYSSATKSSLNSLENSLTTLKNSLAVAFAPILDTVVPILTKFINMLATAANYVSMFFAMLQGKSTYTAAIPVQEEYASSMEGTASATSDAAQATEDATKANKEYLSGLDEINKYTEDSALSGTGSGGSGASGSPGSSTSSAFETRTIDSSLNFDSWGEAFDKFLDYLLNDGIPALEKGLTKLASWINTFSDNLYEMFTFPGVLEKVELLGTELADCINDFVNLIDWNKLGRAMGAGLNLALNFLTSMIYEFDWQNLGAKLAELLNGLIDEIDFYNLGLWLWAKFKIALETFAGFFNNLDMPEIAQKLSSLILGFFDSMAETIQSIDWGQLGTQIRTFLIKIDWAGICETVKNAAHEAFLGMGQFLYGLLGLDPDNFEVDFNGLKSSLSNGLAGIEAIVSGALLALGALLAFTGAALPLGLGLLAAGAAGLASQLAANWGSVSGELAGTIASITAVVGTALLAIGAILTFTGANVPLGLGLLVGGAVALVSGITANWGGISGQVAQVLSVIEGVVGAAMLAVGAVLCFSGVGIPLGIALMAAGGVSLVAALEPNWGGIVKTVSGVLSSLGKKISGGWETIKTGAETAWDTITTTLGTAWNGIKTTASTAFNNVKTTVSGVWDNVKTTASTKWRTIKNTLSTAWEGIKTTAGSAFDTVETTVSDVWDNVSTTASTMWDSITTTLGTAWDGIKTTAGTSFDNIKTTVSGTWNTVKTDAVSAWRNIRRSLSEIWDKMKTTCGSAFEGMKDVIKAPINSIIGFCNKFISGIVTAINSVIKALNKISVDIPSWVPGVGGSTFGINIPTISSYPTLSYLATGAVIPPQSEFLAVLGDQKQGNNIEAPESLLRKIVREETAQNNKGGQYEFTAQINRRTLFDEFINEAKLRQMQTGKNPLAF